MTAAFIFLLLTWRISEDRAVATAPSFTGGGLDSELEAYDCGSAACSTGHHTPRRRLGHYSLSGAYAAVQWVLHSSYRPLDADYDDFYDYSDYDADFAEPKPGGYAPPPSPPKEPCPEIGFEYGREIVMSADPAASTIECSDRCRGFPGACLAWTWVDPARAVNRSDLGVCYLMYDYDSGLSYADNGIWTGTASCDPSDSSDNSTGLRSWSCPGEGFAYDGGDYLTLGAASPERCRERCLGQELCEAWTWWGGNYSFCNLKRDIFRLERSSRAWAGSRACSFG
mmetsp:Transcript_56/g.116  ORF Transcript_56/g.116 Transcript_56/m.116 type:complete len:283 (+) Transcript_56:856-1704(+)